jgi:SHS2 domain-containing protein
LIRVSSKTAHVNPRWELFPHDADMGVRGVGPTCEQAFEQAALALTAVITDPSHVEPLTAVEVRCEALDIELLFVEWLNRLVYEMAVRGMLFSRFSVSIQGRSLRGTAWGEPADPDRHEPCVEVKGATYTALQVAPIEGGWVAQTVVDV